MSTQLFDPETLRETVNRVRADPRALDAIVKHNWSPKDPMRQEFRKAVRTLMPSAVAETERDDHKEV